MPRLTRSLDPLHHILKLSLGPSSASQELHWIRQHVTRFTPPGDAAHRQLYIDKLVRQRASGMPLAYVLGDQPFGPLSIACRPPTLIPRPETEHWVLQVASLLPRRPLIILDICTGTGCIPLLLAHTCSSHGAVEAVAVDISPSAIELAQFNIRAYNKARKIPFNIKLLECDFFNPEFVSKFLVGAGPFDVITCNPPYIPPADHETLPSSVRDHEDRRALVDYNGTNPDGFSFYRRLVEVLDESAEHAILSDDCIIAVEHGTGQSDGVRDILSRAVPPRRKQVEAWRDQWGRPRAVILKAQSRTSDAR